MLDDINHASPWLIRDVGVYLISYMIMKVNKAVITHTTIERNNRKDKYL